MSKWQDILGPALGPLVRVVLRRVVPIALGALLTALVGLELVAPEAVACLERAL